MIRIVIGFILCLVSFIAANMLFFTLINASNTFANIGAIIVYIVYIIVLYKTQCFYKLFVKFSKSKKE